MDHETIIALIAVLFGMLFGSAAPWLWIVADEYLAFRKSPYKVRKGKIMPRKYEESVDSIIAEIKESSDPDRTRVVGRLLADLVFACDASHTLRDWDWHIEQGHVTAENQHERHC